MQTRVALLVVCLGAVSCNTGTDLPDGGMAGGTAGGGAVAGGGSAAGGSAAGGSAAGGSAAGGSAAGGSAAGGSAAGGSAAGGSAAGGSAAGGSAAGGSAAGGSAAGGSAAGGSAAGGSAAGGSAAGGSAAGGSAAGGSAAGGSAAGGSAAGGSASGGSAAGGSAAGGSAAGGSAAGGSAAGGSAAGGSAAGGSAGGAANLPPVPTQVPMLTVAENATNMVTLTATDPEMGALTFAITSAPAFVTRIGAVLTINPGFTDAGMFTVSWTVSDGINPAVPSSFVLIITNTNRAPVFDPIATVTMTAGTTRNVPLVATDPDGDAVTFSSSSLPAYGSIVGATLTLTPSAAVSETILVTVSARDPAMASSLRTFQLTVSPPANVAPTLSALNMVDGVGAPVTAGAAVTAAPTLRATVDDPENATVALEIELRTTATMFTNVATHQTALSAEGLLSLSLPSLAPGSYKWQARARDQAGATSGWSSFSAGATAFTLVGGAVSGTISIDANAVATGSTAVTLTFTSATGVGATITELCFSNSAVFAPGDCQAAPSNGTRPWTLSGPDGQRTVSLRIRDNAARELIINDTIILDTTPPSTGSVLVNGTALYTNDPAVTLTFTHDDGTGTGVTHACAVSVPAPGPQPAPAATNPCFLPLATTGRTLVTGDQQKWVYVWYRDAVNNVSVTPALDTITLDTTSPFFATGALSNGDTYATSMTVTFNNTMQPDLSGPAQVCVGELNPPTTCIPYSTSPTITFSPPEGLKTAYIRVIDAAGNSSTVVPDSITIDTIVPVLTAFTPPAFTRTVSVTGATVAATDVGSGLASTRVTNDVAVVTTFAPFATNLGAFPVSVGDGVKNVTARVFDAAGNPSNAIATTVLLDTVAPAAPTVVIDFFLATTPDATVNVVVTPAESVAPTATTSGIAARCVRQRRAADPIATAPGPTDGCFSAWSSPFDVVLLAQGDRAIDVYLRDGAGNVSAVGSDTILFDTVPPTPPTITGVVAGHRSITLTWTAASDGPDGTGIASYLIWSSTTSGGPYHPAITVPGNATSFVVPLANELTHYLVVSALDGVGQQGQAPGESVGTPHFPYQSTFRTPDRLTAAARGPGGVTALFMAGPNGGSWRNSTLGVGAFTRVDMMTDRQINALASDNDFIFAAGVGGHLAWSSQGVEFRTVVNADPRDLNDVVYAGANATDRFRVAVGAGGLILRSVRPLPTGALVPPTFNPVASGTSQNLNGVAFCITCTNVVVAVGAGGTIIRSTDFGATWAPATVPAGYTGAGTNFTEVVHVPGTTNFIVGVGGSWSGMTSLLRSTDSGATFSQLITTPALNSPITALHAESAAVVRVAAGTGAAATLWRLNGTTLTSDALPTGPSTTTGLFYGFASSLVSSQAAVVGNSGNVFTAPAGSGVYTPINGANLTAFSELATSRTCSSAYAVSFNNALYRSPDTLNPVWTSITPPFNQMTGAAMTTASELFIVGTASGGTGRIYRSLNANTAAPTFTQMTSNTTNGFNAIRCTTASRCVAVGSNGTVDVWNGSNWTVQALTPATTATLSSVALWTDGAIERTIVGGFGGIAYRIDRDTSLGTTTVTQLDFSSATAPSSPTTINISDVVAKPGVLIAAVTSNLILYGIYRSTDNGTTWTRVLTNSSIASVENINGGTVFLAAGTDQIFRSTDDGLTWTGYPTSQAHSIQRVLSCTPASAGSITRILGAAVNGTLIHSLNGGRGG
ncbi:MAG: hypothetical protein Q8L14_15435 [Myxococcales bacterium]|nr:hypothetical protein [Myxococcales bacterium]